MEFEKTADASATPADQKTGAKTYHFVNEYENRRTIDHETGAYLVYEGGGGGYDSPDERFSLHWQGEKIAFDAGLDESFDKNGNRNIKWTFSVMGIPYHMKPQRDEIVEMVKQALDVHGYIYRREKYQKVDVEYIKPIPYEI